MRLSPPPSLRPRSAGRLDRRPALGLLIAASLALASAARAGDEADAPAPQPSVLQRVQLAEPLRALVIGGGFDPVSNQISISQDLQDAAALLEGPKLTLFAGGQRSPVSVLEKDASPENLETLLEDLLGDPEAAQVGFQEASWRPDGPATAAHVLDVLGKALQQGDGPLLVYAAGHGEAGEIPEDCAFSLWGGWSLLSEDLAVLLDDEATRRSLHLVLTSCFGGGFAHLALHGPGRIHEGDAVTLASTRLGPAAGLSSDEGSADRPIHCGLFAAPWNDESSGCDPDPERASHESYGVHFLRALAGTDRDGRALPSESLDLDGDGRIGLLDAHTRARIASRSIDIPVTTSEHWLREQLDPSDELSLEVFELLPEEQAVVAILGGSLGLETAEEAAALLADLDARLAELADLADEARLDADDAYWALRISLLERWPLLSRAWSTATRRLLDRESQAIYEMATASETATRYAAARDRWENRLALYDKVRLRRALVARVARSWETLALASAASRIGGPVWEHYLDLLACERWAPATKGPP